MEPEGLQQALTSNAIAQQQESAKILLVDDAAEVLEVLSCILGNCGYEVEAARSAEDAIEILETTNPDIIICDILMPHKSGFELYRDVKRNPELSTVPFLFLTAMSSAEEMRVGKELGCDDYLTKPFDPDDLVSVVRGKLTLARHRKKVALANLEGYRRRIIHTLSHEFRTPLVSINTGAELLIDQLEDLKTEQVVRLLRSVWRGGQRLERLVDDFMLLQQIDLGHAKHTRELYTQKLPVKQILENAIECYSESIMDGSHPKIVLQAPEEECFIKVYDVQVINVIHRLLSNAHKFGGRDGRIEIRVVSEDDFISIKIRDWGPGLGLKIDMIEKACEAFSQLDRDIYEQQGCGLGLTIAGYFANINGGKITFETPEDGVGLEANLKFRVAD